MSRSGVSGSGVIGSGVSGLILCGLGVCRSVNDVKILQICQTTVDGCPYKPSTDTSMMHPQMYV